MKGFTMALTAAQATRKSAPAASMAGLYGLGLLLRLCALMRPEGAEEAQAFAALSAPDLHTALAGLHFDGHLSLFGLLAYGARTAGVGLVALRCLSCLADGLLGLAWMLWLRRHSPRAATMGTALWASAPAFLHGATRVGPHAALALATAAGWLALWPVWQKAKPSRHDHDLLTAMWALLVFVHPLGIVVVLAMVCTAIVWPHASAAALANSLATGVGQAGRLAHNLARPSLVAATVFATLVVLDQMYPQPDAPELALAVTGRRLIELCAEMQGLRAFAQMGQAGFSLPAVAPYLALGVTVSGFLAAWGHPTGRRLATTAALYVVGLAAYSAGVRPALAAATLVPAWALLLPATALGLAQMRPRKVATVGVAALVLWQAGVWLTVL
jgi:hypothetical protein